MQTARTPEEKIVDTIRAVLRGNFGATSASAIDFYADAHIALSSPSEYTRMLQNIFGSGTEHLLSALIAGLGNEFGAKFSDSTTLDDLILTIRQRQPPSGSK